MRGERGRVREVRSEIGVLGGGLYGGGLVGRVASTEPRVPGLVGRWRVGALRARERAVMLTAVQSLRLLIRRGLWGDKRRDAASSVPGMDLN